MRKILVDVCPLADVLAGECEGRSNDDLLCSGIASHNFVLSLVVSSELFGYYECDSVEFAAKVQANSPVVDRWNEYMKDVMVMEMDPVTGAQPLMKQVFFFG